MKLFYSFLTTLIVSQFADAQTITIPDLNFKNKLLSASPSNTIAKNASGNPIEIDANSNGEIEISEALAVYQLNVSTAVFNDNNNLANLTGIEHFVNLTYLNANGNDLASVDLTALTDLEIVQLRYNDLTSFNTAGLTNLTELWLNDNQITAIDMSNTPNLTKLYLNNNSLTTLDLTMISPLMYAYFSDNNLTTVNISGLSNLNEVIGSGNQLTTLDLTGLTNLMWLNFESNQLNTLDFSNLESIMGITCSNNPLAAIDVDGLTTLTDLIIENTLVTNIDASNSGMVRLHCSNNALLENINLQNGQYSNSDPDMLDFAFLFQNLPELVSICIDEQEYPSLEFSYYNEDEVLVMTGPDCTLLAESFQKGAFTIYPNPASDRLYIGNNIDMAIESVEIYNLIGQKVNSIAVNNMDDFAIDTSRLDVGVYIIELVYDGGRTTQKLIKQ